MTALSWLTVLFTYGSVDAMDYDDQVLEALASGRTVTEVSRTLALSRQGVYNSIERLTVKGSIARYEVLPEGAVTETCPSPHATLLADPQSGVISQTSVMIDTLMRGVRADSARYGMLPPSTTDERYTGSQWTGQAVRRVDYKTESSHVMVVGFLVPRLDKKTWDRAVPSSRLVYVESSGEYGSYAIWKVPRAGYVDIRDVIDRVAAETRGELTDLTLAVAWVCEARAITRQDI